MRFYKDSLINFVTRLTPVLTHTLVKFFVLFLPLNRGLQAIQNTSAETRVTMETINLLLADEKVRIVDSKQDALPDEPDEVLQGFFDQLCDEINTGFDTHFS